MTQKNTCLTSDSKNINEVFFLQLICELKIARLKRANTLVLHVTTKQCVIKTFMKYRDVHDTYWSYKGHGNLVTVRVVYIQVVSFVVFEYTNIRSLIFYWMTICYMVDLVFSHSL